MAVAAPRPVALQGLDFLITAAIRLPSAGACLMGSALTVEIARRGISDLLGWVGFNESKPAKAVYELIPATGRKLLNITRVMDNKELALSAAGLCFVGTALWEISGIFLGQPSPWYNKVGEWLGPTRLAPLPMRQVTVRESADGKTEIVRDRMIGNDKPYHHPVVQFAINWWNKKATA